MLLTCQAVNWHKQDSWMLCHPHKQPHTHTHTYAHTYTQAHAQRRMQHSTDMSLHIWALEKFRIKCAEKLAESLKRSSKYSKRESDKRQTDVQARGRERGCAFISLLSHFGSATAWQVNCNQINNGKHLKRYANEHFGLRLVD